jgi:hypothetical protein
MARLQLKLRQPHKQPFVHLILIDKGAKVMEEKIKAIDTSLSSLLAGFAQLAASVPFQQRGNLFDAEEVAAHDYPGIYLIEVCTRSTSVQTLTDWISAFRDEWMHEMYRDMFVANPQKKRMNVHLAAGHLKDWMPIYIGKSKNISSRLQEHVSMPLGKKTFAMKLDARPTMKTRQWRFSTISLEGVENYGVIAPQMEGALRDCYHPIVGRQ